MLVRIINWLIKNTSISPDNISDGSHTFDELYRHRYLLYIAMCTYNPESVWKSRLHSDGTITYSGYFILGKFSEEGRQISYHLPNKYWDICDFAKTLDKAPKFDGHTSGDVLERLVHEINTQRYGINAKLKDKRRK